MVPSQFAAGGKVFSWMIWSWKPHNMLFAYFLCEKKAVRLFYNYSPSTNKHCFFLKLVGWNLVVIGCWPTIGCGWLHGLTLFKFIQARVESGIKASSPIETMGPGLHGTSPSERVTNLVTW